MNETLYYGTSGNGSVKSILKNKIKILPKDEKYLAYNNSEKILYDQELEESFVKHNLNKFAYEILDQCCGSKMFVPDPVSEVFHPGSRVKKLTDPEFGSAAKNLSISNPK
jgi:hypothetical protein